MRGFRPRAALVALAVAVVALLLPDAVQAQQPEVRITAGVGATAIGSNPPAQNFNIPAARGPVSLPETTVQASGAGSNGVGTVVGTADFGSVVARVSMAAAATGPFDLAGANGSFNVTWVDWLTPTGPPGQSVTFRLRLGFTGTATATAGNACLNMATLSGSVGVGAAGNPILAARRGQPGPPCNDTAGESEQTVTFNGLVGSQMVAVGTLNLAAAVLATNLVSPANPVAVPTAQAAADLSQGMVVVIEALTPGASFITASGSRYDGALTPLAPTVGLAGVPATARAGDLLSIGLDAANPAAGSEADLYVGALLPDGHSVAFMNAQGQVVGSGNLMAPVSFIPAQVGPPGGRVASSAFLVMPVPPPGVLPPGAYTLFAALARRGAFADNVIGQGDILAITVRTVLVLP